jgi:imidazole glycerol-phosphate synthase subunit HisH
MDVTVIDYDIGNLYSVQRALETVGARVSLSSDPTFIAASERVVLPGVGAFADCMRGLRERDLTTVIRNFALSGKPLLGICVGMQMLATTSEEFGTHEGLGVIPGKVVAIPDHDRAGARLKIPAIGWRPMQSVEGNAWTGTALGDSSIGTAAYFVHSFHVVPDDQDHTLATYDHGGHAVTAAIGRGRILGTQFHPEKSGPAGLRMLARFLRR